MFNKCLQPPSIPWRVRLPLFQRDVNLAWQAQAFAPGTSLQRGNVFLRLSGKHEAWEPALDWLYTPFDHGSVWTASLSWQGDCVRVEGGLRAMAGPCSAIVRQLPVQRQAYAAVTWSF